MAAGNNFNRYLKEFRQALCAAHNPERAENEKRYLKSPHKFFGVSVPFIEELAQDFKKEHADISKKELFALTGRLWSSEYHQEKTLAIRLLGKYSHYLDIRSMPMLERMLSESAGWDHVDGISNHLVSTVLRWDNKAYVYLDKWSRSRNFWMRRASLISQILLFREGRGDKHLFFLMAEGMIDEEEVFIRKAIGWTLREMCKTDSQAVFDFLMKIKGRAAGLTLREGAKRLPDEMRKKILTQRQTWSRIT